MGKAIHLEGFGLELEETTNVNIRQVLENNERAITALSAFAQPVRPLELVPAPKQVRTTIRLEVAPEFLREAKAVERKPVQDELHWIEWIALLSVAGLAFLKLGSSGYFL